MMDNPTFELKSRITQVEVIARLNKAKQRALKVTWRSYEASYHKLSITLGCHMLEEY